MKIDLFNATFPNEFRASPDDLDVRAQDWVLHECLQQAHIMRHQGCESVMFLTDIVGSTILRPLQVTEGVKLNAQS